MAKAILLVRVSTENQSFEQQTKELINVALKDGYDKSDLIIIENKESAIKNDEEHRLVEKPREFDSRGQATMTLASKNTLTPYGKIRMTPENNCCFRGFL